MPVYQRRDGATIKLGYLVKRTNGDQTAFAVKQILTRKDLGEFLPKNSICEKNNRRRGEKSEHARLV